MNTTAPTRVWLEPRRTLVLVVILLVTVFFLTIRSPDLPETLRVWIIDLSWMAATVIAGARLLLTASRSRDSNRIAFLLFGLGSACGAAGMLIWNYHELLLGQTTPFPSLADVGFLLAAPLYAAGLIAYQPPTPRPGRFMIRTGNLGMIATALAAVLIIQLYNVLHASPHGALYHTTALMWPAVYGIAAAFGLFALTVDLWGARRKVLWLLVTAIILHATAAIIYAEQLLLSMFATGSEIDVLWVLAFGLKYIAAVEQDRLAGNGTLTDEPAGPILTPAEAALPPLMIGLVILTVFFNRHDLDAALFVLLTPIGLGFSVFLAMRGWWVHRVTLRIRAAELDALRRLATNERRLRNIFQTVSDGLLVIDDGGRIHEVNPAAATLFAIPADELRNRRLTDLLDDEIEQTVITDSNTVPLIRRELIISRPDGTTMPVTLAAARFPATPGEPSLSLTLHDLSEQRAAEEARQRAARMAAIGRVTAGVAHDFNNLLTVIIGNAETLAERSDRPEPLVEGILTAAERCANLTRRLMAFSQQQPLQSEPLEIARLVDSATRRLGRVWSPDIQLRVEHPETPIRAFADRVQLEQALIDLLKNALEAMPDGGTIQIRSEAMHVTGETGSSGPPPGSYVSISISDTGCGMTPEVLEQASEPFYTTKPFGLGAGLGLPMVQGFVAQSGGDMSLTSVPGRGTTVTLRLPQG